MVDELNLINLEERLRKHKLSIRLRNLQELNNRCRRYLTNGNYIDIVGPLLPCECNTAQDCLFQLQLIKSKISETEFLHSQNKYNDDNITERCLAAKVEIKRFILSYDIINEVAIDYENWKNKTLDMNIEVDGFPSTGRLNLCRFYSPVKHLINVMRYSIGDEIFLKTGRDNNAKAYIVTKISIDKNAIQLNDNLFIIDYTKVADAYNVLFSCNKELCKGWQFRTLMLCDNED